LRATSSPDTDAFRELVAAFRLLRSTQNEALEAGAPTSVMVVVTACSVLEAFIVSVGEAKNCPIALDSPEGFAAYLACENNSETGFCGAYLADAACAGPLEADGGVASACNAGSTFQESARAIVKLFCGGIMSDAGDGG
jgi:hypothetical protein